MRETEIDSPEINSSAPRLALVVGSGGVRSIAAAGIADVLVRAGFRPDLIVGCSSGALFGATIAMGLPGYQSLAAATKLWSAELTEQRNWRSYLQLVAPRLAGFDRSFAMRDDSLIRARIEEMFGDRRLDSLLTPLRVVATDAHSGEAVVLTRGSLVAALRASLAVPFIFPSVEVDGRRLIDGVVSDPLPIAAAADAAAVVAIGFEGGMPRRVDRASRLVGQVTTAMINNLQRARVSAARLSGQPLVCLELSLNRRVGLWETAALPYLFEAGRRAAEARLDEIVAMLERPIGMRPPPRLRLQSSAPSAA